MLLCPCCLQDWPGPDRIAFLERNPATRSPPAIITPKGHVWFGDRAFHMIHTMHETRGGLPGAELRAQDPYLSHRIARWNEKLVPLGWHIKKISHKNTTEAYGLCEILRNERGPLNCRARKPKSRVRR